jgi:hypothetical protein
MSLLDRLGLKMKLKIHGKNLVGKNPAARCGSRKAGGEAGRVGPLPLPPASDATHYPKRTNPQAVGQGLAAPRHPDEAPERYRAGEYGERANKLKQA